MSAPDREAYAVRQAQLLDALLRGDMPPPGFDAAQAGAAGRSLRRKRARAVAHAWPALALGLGERFDTRFDAFARVEDAPPSGDPLADGLAFVRGLARADLTDDARAELLLARAGLRRDRGGRWRRRRMPFVGAVRLDAPSPRTLVVAWLPWRGRRCVAIARRPRI